MNPIKTQAAQIPGDPLHAQVFIVTGASSGIGAATARLLAERGARVVLAARRQAACEALLAEIRKAGGDGLVVPTDVTQDADMARLVQRTLQTFGRLDGAFNNAGVFLGGPSAELSEADYDQVFNANVRSACHALRHQVPVLRDAGRGALVFNASVAGLVGFANAALYTASKHAVLGLVRAAALELAPFGLRVNAVCPGMVNTPMADAAFGGAAPLQAYVAGTPAGRSGSPAEIAAAVAFLLSSAASFVNGSAMVVDGGYTAE